MTTTDDVRDPLDQFAHWRDATRYCMEFCTDLNPSELAAPIHQAL